MPMPEPQQIAVAVVVLNDQVLIGRREPGRPLAGLWEFPGGKVHPGEDLQDAARRECLEETGLAIRALRLLCAVDYEYAHGAVKLFFYEAAPEDPLARPHAPFTWVPISALSAYEFPPANAEVLAALLRRSQKS
jgi:mutator protein MutT